ncbi:MAG: response regulator [Candidatus Magnetomorum sp.]|nr:response regulator [Candidatus Magnetomorum sp.]
MNHNNIIMIIDDEKDIRDVMRISLMDLGYQVIDSDNGESALKLFNTILPSIVITDIKMPGMDGIELLQKIKEIHPNTEVIMITGHGDIDLAIKSLKYEATDFVMKPLGDEVLKIALKRAFQRIEMKTTIKEYTENLEHLVEEKSKQLITSERMAAVGETVAGMAHVIKNISASLKGGSYVLEQGIELNNTEYLHQGWQMLKSNVDKIQKLAIDLLTFSKASAITPKRCSPHIAFDEAIKCLGNLAASMDIHLHIEKSQNLDPIEMDSEAITRCLLDLIHNALDSFVEMPFTGIEKRVIIQSKASDDWGVEYHIIDNGCGMDSDTQKKLFSNFFSTKGTRGTGFGLMMTQKIVDQHHGAIQVVSEKEKGSTFVICLPKIIG